MRMKDMDVKVFGIGLPRCGGQTLQSALSQLLGQCTHSPGNSGEEYYAQSASCVEVFRHPAVLDKLYPDCKFIVNTRSRKPWLKSCAKVYPQSASWNHPIWKYPLSDFESYADEYFNSRYQWFNEAMASAQRKLRVFFWDFTAHPMWQGLCSFLDIPVPDVEFPNVDPVGRRRKTFSL